MESGKEGPFLLFSKTHEVGESLEKRKKESGEEQEKDIRLTSGGF